MATTTGLALSALAMTFALGSPAQATSVRTFVASTGSDSNTASNCPRTAPCRNLSAAFGVTTAGGEIVALDSAGYGTLTINKAVTIVGVDGAFIAVPANGVGITITAGASDLIVLRNIQITGAGASNTTGVQLNAGKLVIHNSSFRSMSVGLSAAGKADVIDSEFFGNTIGIATTGTGTDDQVFPIVYGPTSVHISGGSMVSNTTAMVMHNPGTRATPPANKTTFFVRLLGNSSADWSLNVASNGTLVSGDGATCTNDVNNCKAVLTYSGSTNPL